MKQVLLATILGVGAAAILSGGTYTLLLNLLPIIPPPTKVMAAVFAIWCAVIVVFAGQWLWYVYIGKKSLN